MIALALLAACRPAPAGPPKTHDTATPTDTGPAHTGAHTPPTTETGWECGGAWVVDGTPILVDDPDRPGGKDTSVCLETRSLAEACGGAWSARFGGCPDLATFEAAIVAGTVDPGGTPIGRALVSRCGDGTDTWTRMSFAPRVWKTYDLVTYEVWFGPDGALSMLVSDYRATYGGRLCCQGEILEEAWSGTPPPAGLGCVDDDPIVGPPADSGGTGGGY